MQKNKLVYVVFCMCIAFLMNGCGSKNDEQSAGVLTPVPTVAQTTEHTLAPVNKEEPTIAPLENMEVTIYTLNSETLEKEAVTVLVTLESELTPELIVEQVVEAMDDEGFIIGINEIIPEGDTVIVDFKADAAPVCDVGASVEGSILDIIGQSILDNLPQYKKIIVRIEGGPYHTGHFEFGLDEVYIGR